MSLCCRSRSQLYASEQSRYLRQPHSQRRYAASAVRCDSLILNSHPTCRKYSASASFLGHSTTSPPPPSTHTSPPSPRPRSTSTGHRTTSASSALQSQTPPSTSIPARATLSASCTPPLSPPYLRFPSSSSST